MMLKPEGTDLSQSDNRHTRTEFIEPEIPIETEETEQLSDEETAFWEALEEPQEDAGMSPEAMELAARIEERRRRNRIKAVRRKRRRVFFMVVAFAVLVTMCSREIVVLKAENRALKKQHAELEQERDRLTRELSNVGNKEYIKEQARKQLRLLDPGEIMFVFEEAPPKKEDKEAGEKKDQKDKSDKDSGSDE